MDNVPTISDQVFMNHSFNTPLYEMLRMVKKQLEKRETRDGFKQGMKFEVYIKRMDGFKLLIPFLFRIMVMKASFTSIQELILPLEIFHKSSETSSNSKPKGFSYLFSLSQSGSMIYSGFFLGLLLLS